MEINRTLSRPTLTVQNMTVDEALRPVLPLVATPRCDLRPSPGTATLVANEEKKASLFDGMRETVASPVLPSVSQYSTNVQNVQVGVSHPITPQQGRPIHPPDESGGAFWAVDCKATPFRIILSYVVVPAQAMMPVPDKFNRCSVNVHKKEG